MALVPRWNVSPVGIQECRPPAATPYCAKIVSCVACVPAAMNSGHDEERATELGVVGRGLYSSLPCEL